MRVLIGKSQHVIELSEIDTSWDFKQTFPDTPHLRIHSIQVTSGSGTTDKFVFRDGGEGEARFWVINATDATEDRGKEFDGLPIQLYLDYNGGTYSAGSFVTIILAEPPFAAYKPGRI